MYEHNFTMTHNDELTFGSRPPTAPKRELKEEEDELDRTPAQTMGLDNSLVHMGMITADKRNFIIGNAFQNPQLNYDKTSNQNHESSSYSDDEFEIADASPT